MGSMYQKSELFLEQSILGLERELVMCCSKRRTSLAMEWSSLESGIRI